MITTIIVCIGGHTLALRIEKSGNKDDKHNQKNHNCVSSNNNNNSNNHINDSNDNSNSNDNDNT